MIRADFYQFKGKFREFKISGHAGYAESGKDVVCASVSSAVQLTVNMLDCFDCEPQVSADENIICCSVKDGETASMLIGQLLRHCRAILEEFPKTINITIRRCKYV